MRKTDWNEIDRLFTWYPNTKEEKDAERAIIKKYKSQIEKIGPFVQHQVVKMIQNLNSAGASPEDWDAKIERDNAIIAAWQPKWDAFVGSLRGNYPDSVAEYFEGTRIGFAKTVIPALATKSHCWELSLAKGDKVIDFEINDCGWNQICIVDSVFGIYSDKRVMNRRFGISSSEMARFQRDAEAFGMIKLCDEIGNVIDYFTPARANMSPELIAEQEAKSMFFKAALKNSGVVE